ncbi:hypothetical protein FSP39_017100 [Pinctada imbricata]|uniref:Methyltransferase FkbM domain-containing protein n=1 Tax=Pinctada imbricata TaxID=66713 RepID=A0AA88XPM0_PINIB|nr:hypothetical protein FSP39_017100 [Pinctada imbricata]
MNGSYIKKYAFIVLAVGVICVMFACMTMQSTPVEAVDNKSDAQGRDVSRLDVTSTDPGSLRVWSRDFMSWQRNKTVCSNPVMDHDGVLSSPLGDIPISIYNPKQDIWISRRIAAEHEFDGWKRKTIINILKDDKSLDFIDFGCNIGVYSLTVAKMGRQVLCIDALYLNVQHVCASVKQNKLENKVDIVLNAVSSTRDRVQLAVDLKNMGGTFVDSQAEFVKKIKGKTVSGNHYSNITTITVDDLLTLPVIDKFQKVFIKMDIEGFEARAFEKAKKFFKKIYVKGVLIEWIFHRGTNSGLRIVNFMMKHRFRPHSLHTLKRLPHSPSGAWPGQDILWLKI